MELVLVEVARIAACICLFRRAVLTRFLLHLFLPSAFHAFDGLLKQVTSLDTFCIMRCVNYKFNLQEIRLGIKNIIMQYIYLWPFLLGRYRRFGDQPVHY